MYWPPSESTMLKLKNLVKESLEQGKTFDIESFNFTDIEGEDLERVWEPIMQDHPLSQKLKKK